MENRHWAATVVAVAYLVVFAALYLLVGPAATIALVASLPAAAAFIARILRGDDEVRPKAEVGQPEDEVEPPAEA